MNFVAQLEDYLRDLGAEARKKHPGVKEASERAILKLRTLQNAYVSAVRKANSASNSIATSGNNSNNNHNNNNSDKHPDTTLFRSSDLLHPFLLAANYPNASPKLLDTSFKAMKTLMEANAICPGDGRNMVRVWMIQAQVVVSYSSSSSLSTTSSLTFKDASSVSSSSLSASMTTTGVGGGSRIPDGSAPNASTTTTTATITSEPVAASSSSSWFGSFLSSSTSSSSSSTTIAAASASSSSTMMSSTPSAVSSSHGKGGGHLSPKDLEKLGLDILSCLLQLLELRDLPVSPEQWTQSVTLCCLLYLPALATKHVAPPPAAQAAVKKVIAGVLVGNSGNSSSSSGGGTLLQPHSTVRQAAHSTLPQVLTLLVSSASASSSASSSYKDKSNVAEGDNDVDEDDQQQMVSPEQEEVLQQQYEREQQQLQMLAMDTWEDLLACVLSGVTAPHLLQQKNALHGAFGLCRLASLTDTAQPPSVALSLELLTTLLKELSGVGPSSSAPSTVTASLVTRSRRLGHSDDDNVDDDHNDDNEASKHQRNLPAPQKQQQQQQQHWLLEKVGPHTFAVIDQVLQTMGRASTDRGEYDYDETAVATTTSAFSFSEQNPLELIRLLQLVMVYVQTQASHRPAECRQLVLRLIATIPTATAALRRHGDFEDGHIHQYHPSSSTNNNTGASSSGGAGIATTTNISSHPSSGASTGSGSTSMAGPTTHYPFDALQALPSTCLWKASLCMELLKQIVQDPTLTHIWKHPDSLVQLFESTSDFCTIGASCQDHMALLVAASSISSKNKNNNYKNGNGNEAVGGLFYVAESLATASGITTSNSFTVSIHQSIIHNNSRNANKNYYYQVLEWWRLGKGRDNQFILGDALWIGLNSLLLMIDALDQEVLEQVFAPCLATLQHYLKRFPASGTIVQRSLAGYFKLSKIAMQSDPLLRRALLSSLCKLAMPTPVHRVTIASSFGGIRETSSDSMDSIGNNSSSAVPSSRFLLLRDHNIAALTCLINVIHRQYNAIGSEWSVVMQTFQELSILPIASDLSDNAYVGALSISAAYGRFASFSTCLSDESLLYLAEGLAELVPVVEQQEQHYPQQLQQQSKVDSAMSSANSTVKDESNISASIGEKLMNMGVRAIYGTQDGYGTDDDVPLTERTRNTYAHDCQMEFRRRMAKSKHPIRGVDGTLGGNNAAAAVVATQQSHHHQQPLPFVLTLLADIAISNAFRFRRCGKTLSKQLCTWTATTGSASARLFAMDVVGMLILSHVAAHENDDGTMPEGFPTSFSGPGRIVYDNPRRNQYLAVERVKTEHGLGDKDGDRHLVPHADLLTPLCQFIQTAQIAAVAEAGVDALHSVLESAGHKLTGGDAWAVLIDAVASLSSSKRSQSDWAASCMVGFRCLKLIVDDFIDLAMMDGSESSRMSLMDCCFSFGSSRHDVNTSLTAIGLLWTIADQDAGDKAIDLALSKLVLLSSDSRAEVRNCSVNTLFSCIVGRGQGFSSSQWDTCICTMIFGVYDLVAGKGKGVDGEPSSPSNPSNSTKGGRSRYKVNIHHSRDSSDKQWVATQALVLRGLSRVLRTFFSELLDTTQEYGPAPKGETADETPWFEEAWNRVLGYAFEASTQTGGRDTLDLRNSGVELLVLCSQLACRAGIQAALTPARVGTNMEVVNGALRSVRTPDKNSGRKTLNRKETSSVAELWRENFFLDAFDVLDSFREHLESDAAVDNESGLSPYLEPTQVQVLGKFAGDLCKLYDCCKDAEFLEGSSLDHLSLQKYLGLSPVEVINSDDSLVARYVRMVLAVAERASGGPEARFLSQAQRSCIDLLRSMASNGSNEAFMSLTSMASLAFYSEKDVKVDIKKGIDIMSYEAAKVVSEEISKMNVSDECRILVVCRVLSLYLQEVQHVESLVFAAETTSFKLIAPILGEGIQSAMALEVLGESETQVYPSKTLLLEQLWQKVCNALAYMIKPTVPVGGAQGTILHAKDIVGIVQVATAHIAPRYHNTVCEILASGASQCLELVKGGNADDKVGGGTQRGSDDVLQVFTACFSGVCSMQPENPNIRAMAEHILDETCKRLIVPNTGEQQKQPPQLQAQDAELRATLQICRALQEINGVESLVIALFPQLCKLVGTEQTVVRQAVGSILARVNVGQALSDSQAKFHEAETRAQQAEARATKLALEVEDLQNQNDDLARQVAILTVTTAM